MIYTGNEDSFIADYLILRKNMGLRQLKAKLSCFARKTVISDSRLSYLAKKNIDLRQLKAKLSYFARKTVISDSRLSYLTKKNLVLRQLKAKLSYFAKKTLLFSALTLGIVPVNQCHKKKPY